MGGRFAREIEEEPLCECPLTLVPPVDINVAEETEEAPEEGVLEVED